MGKGRKTKFGKQPGKVRARVIAIKELTWSGGYGQFPSRLPHFGGKQTLSIYFVECLKCNHLEPFQLPMFGNPRIGDPMQE